MKQNEATIFGKYFINEVPIQLALNLYDQAVPRDAPLLSNDDTKLIDFAVDHPWSIGILDGGLALLYPHAELRRRLYLMFAILEAMPEYTRYFLPQKRNVLYSLSVDMVGIRAAIKALLGAILVKVVLRKACRVRSNE